ncbi:hypothetical protein PoB_002832400 [Plakobranchus ocellatus]|uniref:Uncharacterized protein n=1 Tax=Plakobranchus ocellatus TaxID=259542 RepID=A0AAV4A2G3_9GAST|nr:hypothetical protein PoB_002832400 [Plakobranchus ocellatus]
MRRSVSCLFFVVALLALASLTEAAPYGQELPKRMNLLSPEACIRDCQARCGGICYMNMSFQYTCSCQRFG